MTILPTITSPDEKPFTRGDYAYACSRNQTQVHSLLLRVFKESGLTQKELAQRTGIDEATVSRTLARPRNLELNTVSKMLLAAGGGFLKVANFLPSDNQQHPPMFLASDNSALRQESSDLRVFLFHRVLDWQSSNADTLSATSVEKTDFGGRSIATGGTMIRERVVA